MLSVNGPIFESLRRNCLVVFCCALSLSLVVNLVVVPHAHAEALGQGAALKSSGLLDSPNDLTADSSSENVTPDILIHRATKSLIEQIKAARGEDKSIDFYYELVDEKVSPFVDFGLISRRVMGRYYKLANQDERDRFLVTFKESLLLTYAKGIAGYKDQQLVFLPFEGVKERKGKSRAKVEMEIRSPSDAPIPVTYQMFLDKNQLWKLENIVLNGVNLGLTFRNQFGESYKANAGDFSKVISSWGDEKKTASSNN